MQDSISNVSIEDWQKCVHHVEGLLEQDFVKEGLRNNRIENIIIRFGDNSSDDDDDDDDDDDEDDLERVEGNADLNSNLRVIFYQF